MNQLAFDIKSISPDRVIKHLLSILSMFLLASVDEVGLVLALSLYAGLVYAKQNFAISSLCLIAVCFSFNFDVWTCLLVFLPMIILGVVVIVFARLKRYLSPTVLSLFLFLSFVPYMVVQIVLFDTLILSVVQAVICLVFGLCCTNGCFALLFRNLNCRFALDEEICLAIMIAVFAYAMAGISYAGFNLLALFFAFGLLMCSDNFMRQTTIFYALICGIGASVFFGDFAVLGAFALYGLVSSVVRDFTRFASLFAVLAVDALFILFDLNSVATWQITVLLFAGGFAYCIIPKRGREWLGALSKSSDETSVASMLNRNRRNLSERLDSLSDVFYDMSRTLEIRADIDSMFNAKRLSQDISKNYCSKCENKTECFSGLGGQNATMLEPIASAVLNRGSANILDVPTYITSRCTKMHNLLAVVNNAGDAFKKRKVEATGLEVSKKLMSDQFAGISLILDSLSKECAEQVSIKSDESEAIKNELLKHNINAKDVLISGQGESAKLAVTLRTQMPDGDILQSILSRMTKTVLEPVATIRNGANYIVHFESSPIFEVAYGVAEKCRSGNQVSGDSIALLQPSRKRRIFAISDGMGSGESADRASRDTISMVESFYKAGFDNAIILSIINKLLSLSMDESFSSLDMAVFDAVSGAVDIIKMGASDSFVVHTDSVEIVTGEMPPAGIFEKIEPITRRMQLFDGDIMLMMSDGVFDALDSTGVVDVVDEYRTLNPQVLADALLERAISLGADDDCTVLAMRVFCI